MAASTTWAVLSVAVDPALSSATTDKHAKVSISTSKLGNTSSHNQI